MCVILVPRTDNSLLRGYQSQWIDESESVSDTCSKTWNDIVIQVRIAYVIQIASFALVCVCGERERERERDRERERERVHRIIRLTAVEGRRPLVTS